MSLCILLLDEIAVWLSDQLNSSESMQSKWHAACLFTFLYVLCTLI